MVVCVLVQILKW